MDRRTALVTTVEFLAWWAALAVLWLVLISAVDTLELAVGAGVAAVAALAAVAARRAVTGR
ncbi:hypothetical protein [Streptomyces muensis]|uniref:Uncharacterized protein n=1 Tax=Streptomyces muensis TaxID=1077944 RepID=A0A9X1TGV3_STRM4|nr:hypothetical protein [Streptomyces muensis]MCF1592001.1 hypothetical protein [Streptomyces muensis]